MAERPPPRRRHRREPLTAASAVARFRRRASGGGLGAETGAAAAAWADVVGAAAAAHSVPVRRTRAGVLTVACSSASWAQELTMRRDELRERLLARAPDTGVTALRFSVADHVMAGPPEAPPPPRPAPRPTRADAALERARRRAWPTSGCAIWWRGRPPPRRRARRGLRTGEIPANRGLKRVRQRVGVLPLGGAN